MKIIRFIKESSRLLINGFNRFPITYILIAILAVVLEINLQDFRSKMYFEGGLFYGIFVSVLVTLLIEDKIKKHVYLHIIPAVLGVVSSIIMWQLLKNCSETINFFIDSFYVGTLIAMFSLSVWVLCKKENVDTIYMELLWAVLYSVLSVLVLYIGVMVCLLAFDSLIMPIVKERAYSVLSVYSWVGLLPILVLSRIPREYKLIQRPKLYVKFFTYLAIPCVLLLVILCVYVGKIIITLNMPSNRLNIFASICILVYLFMYAAIKENSSKSLSFLLRWCWIPIIPIVIAQITGIVIRYNAYGLTPLRMAGMVTLAIGIYGLYITARNKSLKSIWIVIAIAAIVFSISPINIIDMSVKDQNDRIEKILVKNSLLKDGKLVIPEKFELNDEDKKVVIGSWRLLRFYDGESSPKVLINYFDVNKAVLSYAKETNNKAIDLLTVLNIKENNQCFNNEIYCTSSFNKDSNPISCGGYSYFRLILTYPSKRDGGKEDVFLYKDGKYFLKLKSNFANDSELIEVEVTKFIDRLLENNRTDDNNSETNKYVCYQNVMEISESDAIWEMSDNIMLVIKNLRILDPDTIKVKAGTEYSLKLTGYILYK